MLLTDWQVIGTAGETIDGRVIEESWLQEAVETFDPDNYTPTINAEHMRYYGSFGEVHQLRIGKDKRGRANVQAILKPNFAMCETNKEGQRLFTSMELIDGPDGKTMLSGLALTDNPASFGTTAIKLFSKNGGTEKRFSTPVELFLFEKNEMEEKKDEQEKFESAFMSAFRKFFGRTPNTDTNAEVDTKNETTQDEDMTPEQFDELKNILSSQQQAFTSAIADLKKGSTETNTDDDTNDSDSTNGDDTTTYSDIKAQNDALKAQLDDLNQRFTKALGEAPGTKVGDFTGAADDVDFV